MYNRRKVTSETSPLIFCILVLLCPTCTVVFPLDHLTLISLLSPGLNELFQDLLPSVSGFKGMQDLI